MSSLWYLYKDGQQKGPYSWEELFRQAEAGAFGPADYVWTEGLDDWVQADIIKGLFAAEPPPLGQSPVTPPSASTYRTKHTGNQRSYSPRRKSRGGLIALITVLMVLILGGGYLAYNIFIADNGNGIATVLSPDEPSEDRPSTGHESEDDNFRFDVVWSDEATVLDEDQRDMVVRADLDNHIYHFDARAVSAAGIDLSPGRVLVIHGLSLRRIAEVREENDQLVVTTDFAALTDAIDEGVIEWDYQISFDEENIEAFSLADQGVMLLADSSSAQAYETLLYRPGTAYAVQQNDDGSFSFSFDVDGYKITCKIIPQGERLAVEIIGRKGVGGAVTAEVKAIGAIESFQSSDRIVIAGGELQEYVNNFDHLRGEFDLEAAVIASGRDVLDFNFPMPIMRYVFLVGYMPVTITVDAQFIVNMAVPADGSSRLSAGFSYDSRLGFAFDGVNVKSDGSLAFLDMGSDQHDTAASSPISANFGMGFPRLRVGMFGNTVVPWVQTAFIVGGSYTVLPPCQTADISFLGAGGIDLEFLGFKHSIPAETFFRIEEPLLRAGDCPDD